MKEKQKKTTNKYTKCVCVCVEGREKTERLNSGISRTISLIVWLSFFLYKESYQIHFHFSFLPLCVCVCMNEKYEYNTMQSEAQMRIYEYNWLQALALTRAFKCWKRDCIIPISFFSLALSEYDCISMWAVEKLHTSISLIILSPCAWNKRNILWWIVEIRPCVMCTHTQTRLNSTLTLFMLYLPFAVIRVYFHFQFTDIVIIIITTIMRNTNTSRETSNNTTTRYICKCLQAIREHSNSV